MAERLDKIKKGLGLLLAAYARNLLKALKEPYKYWGRSTMGEFFAPFITFLLLDILIYRLSGTAAAAAGGLLFTLFMLPLAVRRLNDTGRRGMFVMLYYLAYSGVTGLFSYASAKISLDRFLAFDLSLVTIVPLFISAVLVLFWAIATLHMFNLMFYRTKIKEI